MVENFLTPTFFYLIAIQILPLTEEAISFTKQPDSPSYVKKGNNATLVWDYSVTDRQKELKFIIWAVYYNSQFHNLMAEYKNGDRVIAPGIPSAYSGRVGIEGRATLVIENITSQDKAIFQCTLRAEPASGLQDQIRTTRLIVAEMPVISPSLTNGSYIEGSSVNIGCSATAKPDPKVSWIRNGQTKSSGRNTAYLNFNQINRTDDGLYTCIANNLAGTKSHKEILVVRYPAKILSVTSQTTKSWMGQNVTLKCVSDAVPTPTLTWYKPDGIEINSVTAKESTVKVFLSDEHDFGEYKCTAYNGLDPSNNAPLTLAQIQEPRSPIIISSATDIQATSLTVKWTAPADDGGSPITAYRVVILKGGTEIRNVNITDLAKASLSVGNLERETEYNVKVFARNAIFEGAPAQKIIRTKAIGIPETPGIIDLSAEIHSDELVLKWKTPSSNGADITQYTVYIRNVTSKDTVGDWRKIEVIYDVSIHAYVITLRKGQQYDLVVTATNKYGESLKEQLKIKRIRVLGESTTSFTNQNQTVARCDREVEILHAVYLSVIILLVIIIVVISVIHWRIRRGPAIPKCGQRISRSSRSSRADSIQMSPVDHHEAEVQSTETIDTTSITYEIPNRGGDYMPLHPSTRSWEISREQVDIIKNIGKGAFPKVAEATAKNIYGNQGVITVAVKMLKDNAPESDKMDLLSELEVMKKLKPHPHVIKMIGCVTESGKGNALKISFAHINVSVYFNFLERVNKIRSYIM